MYSDGIVSATVSVINDVGGEICDNNMRIWQILISIVYTEILHAKAAVKHCCTLTMLVKQ